MMKIDINFLLVFNYLYRLFSHIFFYHALYTLYAFLHKVVDKKKYIYILTFEKSKQIGLVFV